MMGLDQDDIVLAPWTSIKAQVSGGTLTNVNQSNATTGNSTTTATVNAATTVNSLNQSFPGNQGSIYPTVDLLRATDCPQQTRFANIDQILVRANTTDEVGPAMLQITGLLHQRHHIKPGQFDDFGVRDMTEMANALGASTQTMARSLLFVALVSLVVGGVGIMNIMLVSVTERTKEIGLRMAVGARPGDILRQFLTEAVVLCLAGGALGIALGRGVSTALTTILNWPTVPSLEAVVVAVAISAAVGLVFGYYPARTAARLDPIEALRHE
jgi:ABC-type antimicrobial peptide transport system permease subunit